MTRRISILLAGLTMLAGVLNPLRAQYYNTGQSPASLHYRTFKTDSLRIIYPRGFDAAARRTFLYMDSIRPAINYGFRMPPLRTPVVFYTENFMSNGLSIMAPKHIEMGGIPAIETYSEPWLKQLASHEYRHMVLYGNLNRSTVRVFSWLIGQQATIVAAGLVPFWFIEGDAVMAETQMATFGRGLQPSFTLHYRALGREILQHKNPDKWFCGSYRDYVPDHYQLGFQLVSYADKKYERYIGDVITDYTSKYPFFLFTTPLSLKRHYNTSVRKLFRETFSELNDLWDSLPDEENSPQTVSRTPKVYTSYSYPIYLDNHTLLALKEDIDTTPHLVEIDLETGSERSVCHTGIVSTRPVCRDGLIAWTEYRQSMLWDMKVNSQLCIMERGAHTYTCLPSDGDNILYPTIIDRDNIAYVRYDYDGRYAIELRTPQGTVRHEFPDATEIHGLAWDNNTRYLYYIALSDDGMWIEGIDLAESGHRTIEVTAPSYTTIDNLTADDGMLYFNSIYSGKDEAHTIDLSTGRQYRISNSTYGSFWPSPSPTGEFVALATYGRMGYSAAIQEVEYWDEIKQAPLPHNIVNAPLKRWEVPNIDEIVVSDDDIRDSERRLPARRYRRGLNLFNLHSWAPVYFKPDQLFSGSIPEVRFGATLISQNLLSTAESTLGYGYTRDGHSLVRGAFNYYGWAPKIELNATWSDIPHTILTVSRDKLSYTFAGRTFDLQSRVYLPLLLSSGHVINILTPSVQYSFNNRELRDLTANTIERTQLIVSSLQFNHYVRSSRLDLQTPFGYFVRATLAGNPFSNHYSTAWSLMGRLCLPGLLPHNGITLAANYQHNSDALQIIQVMEFLPHGYDSISAKNYWAASVNYMFPAAYPEWGISGVFFLKRIAVNLSFEYAGYRNNFYNNPGRTTHINSVGAVVSLDVAFLRVPDNATTALTLGVYKPRHSSPYVTFGFSIPL